MSTALENWRRVAAGAFLDGIEREHADLEIRARALAAERPAREHDALVAEHLGRPDEAARIRRDFAERAAAACMTCVADARHRAHAHERGDAALEALHTTTCMECGAVTSWSCAPGYCPLCAHSPKWIPIEEDRCGTP